MAAHIAFQVDYLCTGDKPQGRSSIFDSTERAWLTTTYGVQFVTIIELGRVYVICTAISARRFTR